jgi:hypothetical protein
MTEILDLQSFELVEGPTGYFVRYVATIADIIQTSPATRYDPPEFGSSICRGSILIGDDDPLPKTEQQFIDLARDVYDWQPIEDTY